ncbi:MAG TPA: hypothetical protein VGG41_08235 [Solirubrobacteraceae bacterium]|jgi:hypothetical protein
MSASLVHLSLFALPALTLWLMLLRGRYPGERVLELLVRRRRRGPRRERARPVFRALADTAGGACERLAGTLVGRAPPSGESVPTPSTT